MQKIAALLLLLAMPLTAGVAAEKADRWSAVRFMIGTWEAAAEGEPGAGSVKRTYEFVLDDQFIEERNTSTYVPSAKNNHKGEVHRHLSFFSYDRSRKTLVLRQFHQEGFVNTYVLNAAASTPNHLVFVSEHFENFDNSWQGKESYEVISNDEFVEVFELAPPGKPFAVYSKNRFRRVGK